MQKKRHLTQKVQIGNVFIGGNSEIAIQSMTDTNTSDIEETTNQVIDLYNAGSVIVRMTVNNDDAAKAVPYIKENIIKKGYDIPLVGCFHYNGHNLLKKYPKCAQALDKYRINPGNLGFGNKKDYNFSLIIETILENDTKKITDFSNTYIPKAIRIGGNWGSLDTEIFEKLLKKYKNTETDPNLVVRKSLIKSVITSARFAEKMGLPSNQIVLSCKVSEPIELIKIYTEIAKKTNYPLHLGLTEAGIDQDGAIKTASALSVLLYNGYGDTIRVSTTNSKQPRTYEVSICKKILQSLNIRSFYPSITSCPGCGRTNNSFFKSLAQEIEDYTQEKHKEWSKKYSNINNLKIAIMGCVVNGPGESKHANIGISLPGNSETPSAVVFVDGEKHSILHYDDNIKQKFKEIIDNYIEQKSNTEEFI